MTGDRERDDLVADLAALLEPLMVDEGAPLVEVICVALDRLAAEAQQPLEVAALEEMVALPPPTD